MTAIVTFCWRVAGPTSVQTADAGHAQAQDAVGQHDHRQYLERLGAVADPPVP